MRIKQSILICFGISLILLIMSAGTAVAPVSDPDTIVLTPPTDNNPVGTEHTVTATVTDVGGPVAGVVVKFEVISGPHFGVNDTNTTDAGGQATFTYTGTAAGTDVIQAFETDHLGNVIASNTVVKTWFVVPEPVDIDIKPGSFPNSINPNSNGLIPVAILTTADFDATQVDPTTVTFGPAGAPALRSAVEDVDGDGDMDLVLHFKDTGIQACAFAATLTGQTYGGIPIVGTDSVRTVPPCLLGIPI